MSLYKHGNVTKYVGFGGLYKMLHSRHENVTNFRDDGSMSDLRTNDDVFFFDDKMMTNLGVTDDKFDDEKMTNIGTGDDEKTLAEMWQY